MSHHEPTESTPVRPDSAGHPVAVPESSSRDIDAMKRVLPPGSMEEDGRLRIDALCRKCSYNLRGLLVSGKCPECGSPVVTWRSKLRTRPSHIYSDRQWLKKVASGIHSIYYGGAVLIFIMLWTSVDYYQAKIAGPGGHIWTGSRTVVSIISVLSGMFLIVFGILRATAAEPIKSNSKTTRETGEILRKWSRALVPMCLFCMSLLIVASVVITTLPSPANQLTKNVAGAIAFGMLLLLLAEVLIFLGYLQQIAARLPASRTYVWMSEALVALGGSFIFPMVLLFVALTASLCGAPAEGMIGMLLIILGLPMIVSLPVAVIAGLIMIPLTLMVARELRQFARSNAPPGEPIGDIDERVESTERLTPL